jgi:glycosyltransferase involved in cell wall biosynthesis
VDDIQLSVIVCANRGGEYFTDALDSLVVARQGRTNIEVILVANGGWLPEESIVKYFDRVEFTSESGLGNARNLGVSVARGRWVTFFDNDDLLDIDYIGEIETLIARVPHRTVIFAKAVFMTAEGAVLPWRWRLENLPPTIGCLIAHPFTGATMVIPKELFVIIGGYKWNGYAEDYHLTLRILYSKPPIGIIRAPKAYYYYRQHANTMSGDVIKKIRGVREVQIYFARRGYIWLWVGVLASGVRLLLRRIRS